MAPLPLELVLFYNPRSNTAITTPSLSVTSWLLGFARSPRRELPPCVIIRHVYAYLLCIVADYVVGGRFPDFSQEHVGIFRKRIALACLSKYLD